MQTNHRGVATKEPKVTVERIGPQTSITKGPYIHRATSEISQKTQIPPLQKGRGKELSTIVNGLANLETVQISNFESSVERIKQLLSFKILCFKAGGKSKFCKSKFYSK